MTAAALEVDGLVKRYGDRTVVDHLTFSVRTGTVYGLLGPNGAGKTTTVEICEGFRRADAGQVRVLGRAPGEKDVRPRVGVMPQTGGGYPGLRAGELLRLVASYSRNPLDPADLLDRLGLADSATTAWRRLSGGQQQRLSLAMAIVGRPELVFLDEPTAGLDPQARHATWDLIQSLTRDGVTVVLTTHLLDEAEALAEDVLIVDHGKAVAAGSIRELTSAGNAGQVRFGGPPSLDITTLQAVLPPDSAVRETAAGNYLVEAAVDPQLLATITAWCAEQGVLASDLRVEKRSLEDVFLELTGRDLRS